MLWKINKKTTQMANGFLWKLSDWNRSINVSIDLWKRMSAVVRPLWAPVNPLTAIHGFKGCSKMGVLSLWRTSSQSVLGNFCFLDSRQAIGSKSQYWKIYVKTNETSFACVQDKWCNFKNCLVLEWKLINDLFALNKLHPKTCNCFVLTYRTFCSLSMLEIKFG